MCNRKNNWPEELPFFRLRIPLRFSSSSKSESSLLSDFLCSVESITFAKDKSSASFIDKRSWQRSLAVWNIRSKWPPHLSIPSPKNAFLERKRKKYFQLCEKRITFSPYFRFSSIPPFWKISRPSLSQFVNLRAKMGSWYFCTHRCAAGILLRVQLQLIEWKENNPGSFVSFDRQPTIWHLNFFKLKNGLFYCCWN